MQLSWHEQRELDAVCDRFEIAWRQGERPSIEDSLDAWKVPESTELFTELLSLELEYRLTLGHELAESEYLRRFPNKGATIADCFRKTRLSNSSLDDPDSRIQPDLVDPRSGTSLGRQPTLTIDACRTGGDLRSTSKPWNEFSLPFRFGEYELLKEIGHGGMGVVFLANQVGANRLVAVKLILPERWTSDSKSRQAETTGRFQAEAHATARLQHENIVTVFDVGEVDGKPYYSMQFVDGKSLDELVRDQPISNRLAARYSEQLARAIHYAHTQDVLHRDIKPRNIIVDKDDQPFLADFGMAKLLESDQNITRVGPGMGTPSYMSPEQATNASAVGYASDIYGLGATLYMMLTGRPPFQSADPVVTLQQVIDRSPAAPRQLNPDVTKDLETICLKCLEKDPRRRYETAALLADDLERFLTGRPIHARAVGRVETAWRWCKLNPAMSTLATSLVLVLLTGVLGIFWQWQLAVANAQEAQQQSLIAKHNLEKLHRAVDQYFTAISEETLLNEPGMQALRKKLLSEALVYYQGFIEQQADDLTLTAELAGAYLRVGRILGQIGTSEEALQAFEHAKELYEFLVNNNPEATENRNFLARTLTNVAVFKKRIGKRDEAFKTLLEAIELQHSVVEEQSTSDHLASLAGMYNNLGVIHRDLGQYQLAIESYNNALQFHDLAFTGDQRPTENSIALGQALGNLANVYNKRSEFELAEKKYKQAIFVLESIAPDQFGQSLPSIVLARTYNNLGSLYRWNSHADKAFAAYAEAIKINETLVRDNPKVVNFALELSSSFHLLARFEADHDRWDEAISHIENAIKIRQRLVADDPTNIENQYWLASSTLRKATILESRLSIVEARVYFEKSLEQAKQLVARNPEIASYNDLVAFCLQGLCTTSRVLGEHDEAHQFGEQAIDKLRELISGGPNKQSYTTRLADMHYKLGENCASQGQYEETLSWIRQSIEIVEAIPASATKTAVNNLSKYHAGKADALHNLGRYEQSQTARERAIELASPSVRENLRLEYARTLVMLGKIEDALSIVDEAVIKENTKSHTFYQAARVVALSALHLNIEPNNADRFEKSLTRAIELTMMAKELKFFDDPGNLERFDQESDFRAVRSTLEFQLMRNGLTNPISR